MSETTGLLSAKAKKGGSYGSTQADATSAEMKLVTGLSTALDIKTEFISDQSPEGKHIPSKGLTEVEAQALLAEHGRNELPSEKVHPIIVFLTLLVQPMPIMLWVAILTELIIENYPDMCILLGIQFMNASISFYETSKAGDAVEALKSTLKPRATVKRDGKYIKDFDAALLVPGDMVLLGAGGSIPADCLIDEGHIEVDMSAMTGESLPVSMEQGSFAKMGSNVVKGECEATVYKTGANTFFGETAALLNATENKSNLEITLVNIILVLVVLSLTLCVTAFLYLIFQHNIPIREALSFTVVLMVASIPLAIEIVCTTTLALGSREMSKFGAIVSRLSAIEDLAGLTVLCSDKTGTLTTNKMEIHADSPVFMDGEDKASLLRYAAMAARWKEPPRDALDTLVLNAADLASLDSVQQTDHIPFDSTIRRTESTCVENGKTFRVTKGAPDIILGLSPDKGKHTKIEKSIVDLAARGIRALAVAITDDNDEFEFVGLIAFLDPPRPDSKLTIQRAAKMGVQVKMITGDHLLIACETARLLGMGTNIRSPANLPDLDEDGKVPKDIKETHGKEIAHGDGFAQMFPSHKFIVVEALRRMGLRVGMTGDGVNDAPALKGADVGIAVEGSTDTARAASDIVLTQEGLSTIVDGIFISRQIFARMNSFLTYRIAATLQLLFFFFIAVFAFRPDSYVPHPIPDAWLDGDGTSWPEFFEMPVLMLMLITLLNDGTLIAIGYDNAEPNPRPDRWNLPALFLVSSVLAFVAMVSSLLMVHLALDSWRPGSFFDTLGLGGIGYGHITCMVYLKVSISDFLTLFSARTRDKPFWASMPATILLCAGAVAIATSTVLATYWPEGILDGVMVEGLGHHPSQKLYFWVWGYCLAVWFIQDWAKVKTYDIMKSFNMFDYNQTSHLRNLDELLGTGDYQPLKIKSVHYDTHKKHVDSGYQGGMTINDNAQQRAVFEKLERKRSMGVARATSLSRNGSV